MKSQHIEHSKSKHTPSNTKIKSPTVSKLQLTESSAYSFCEQLYSRNRTPTSHTTYLPYRHNYPYSPRIVTDINIYKNVITQQRDLSAKKATYRMKNHQNKQLSKQKIQCRQEIQHNKPANNLKIQITENHQINRQPYKFNPPKTTRSMIGIVNLDVNSPKANHIIPKEGNYDLKQKINDLEKKLDAIRKQYNLKGSRKNDKEKKNSKNITENYQKDKNNADSVTMAIIQAFKPKKDELKKEENESKKSSYSKSVSNLCKNKSQNSVLFREKQNKIGILKEKVEICQQQPQNVSHYRLKNKKQLNKQNQNPNPSVIGSEREKQKIKQSREEQQLKKYISPYKIQNQSPGQLMHCTSENNILMNHMQNQQKNKKTKNQKNQYYINTVLNAYEKSAHKKLTSFQQISINHLFSSFQILHFIQFKNLVHKILSNPVVPIRLPSSSKPKTIVFDLDETLIHCNQTLKSSHDIELAIKFPHNTIRAGINIRPYAQQCLKQLSEHYQLIIYTASHQIYANTIIDYLDPQHQYISHRFFRDSCVQTSQGFYMKDLRVIDRPIKDMLLIDNAAYSYALQPENGVPIIPFYDNKDDEQLKRLIEYLRQFHSERDMRVKNSKIMRIDKYLQYKDHKALINQLYM